MQKDRFTDDEIDFIKKNYKHMSFKEMGDALQRTEAAINTKMRRLGLKSGRRTKQNPGKNQYNDRLIENLSPLYEDWRKAVLKRDGYKCQFPGCNKNQRLQVHHIKKYAEYPELKYIESNGISLCRPHHIQIQGKESLWESLFFKIVLEKLGL